MLTEFVKLFFTRQPQKRFQIECQLMLYFSGRNSMLRKKFQRRIYYKYHCDISHLAVIPKSTRFVHPIGVVIGSNAVLGDNVHIYQNVTLGSNFGNGNAMPKIGDGSIVSAGAKLIGGIDVGSNVIVGANSVITKDIPDDSVVVGSNRIIS